MIRQGDLNSELHSIRSKKKAVTFEGSEQAGNSKESHSKNDFKNYSSTTSKPQFNLKSAVALDVETNMTTAPHVQPHMPSVHTARKQGTSRKYA